MNTTRENPRRLNKIKYELAPIQQQPDLAPLDSSILIGLSFLVSRQNRYEPLPAPLRDQLYLAAGNGCLACEALIDMFEMRWRTTTKQEVISPTGERVFIQTSSRLILTYPVAPKEV